MPRLRLIAGPNGSGKTTLTDQLRSSFDVPLGQYTNPDEIGKSLTLIDNPVKRSRLAQKIPKDLRELDMAEQLRWEAGPFLHEYPARFQRVIRVIKSKRKPC